MNVFQRETNYKRRRSTGSTTLVAECLGKNDVEHDRDCQWVQDERLKSEDPDRSVTSGGQSLIGSTTRNACWFNFDSLFSSRKETEDCSQKVADKKQDTSDLQPQNLNHCCSHPKSSWTSALRRRFVSVETGCKYRSSLSDLRILNTCTEQSCDTWLCNAINREWTSSNKISRMGQIKCSSCWTKVQISDVSKKISGSDPCLCNYVQKSETVEFDNGSIHITAKRKDLTFIEAPLYLKFNPFITGGYRNSLSPYECIRSIFWWTNETLNIWTHLLGWLLFLGLTVYDYFGFTKLPKRQPWDQVVLTMLLLSFQACMLLSCLYHIFCCCSQSCYRRWLCLDLFGVSLSLLAIYISGIYYAFSCIPFWLNFYLVTVVAIFVSAMAMQVIPIVSTEDSFQWRLIVFGGWAAYGVVPTFHWAALHGGMSSEAVAILLPKIIWMYVISAAAFFFYVTRMPERLNPGLVNYLGSSHQLWHIFIVAALYHWHNTGLAYLKFRADHPCSDEYAALYHSTDSIVKVAQN